MSAFLIIASLVLAIGIFIGLGLLPDKVRDRYSSEERPFPKGQFRIAYGIPAVLMAVGIFTGMLFWAEPGYKYHVRDILGEEHVIEGSGFKLKTFGKVNAWKNALSVQSVIGAEDAGVQAEVDSDVLSATIPAKRIVFLDQVDGQVAATARWKLPDDDQAFLQMVHDYRTPENLLRTELIPGFQETLDATAALMGADEYYSGGRTAFISEFEDQLRNGMYQVRRIELKQPAPRATAAANASTGTEQAPFGDEDQVVYKVEKIVDEAGIARRKVQTFSRYGIAVVSGRVTEIVPNASFATRMQSKQDASAAKAINRENRLKEEEGRLLEIAKGDREVAARQAQAKVEQIEKTTNAETSKQLAITAAQQSLESERILKEQAAVALERSRLEADRTKTLADAEAYRKRAILQADNALQAKLDAEVAIQKAYADAFAKRSVPQIYIAGGADATGPGGANNETSAFMSIMTAFIAQRMDYDRKVEN